MPDPVPVSPGREAGAPGGGPTPALEVTTRSLVAGGAAIANAPDGRVVLVEGALPDEEVVVADPVVQRRLVTGGVGSLVRPSPHRVEPPCPALAAGCGGCDLQYAHPDRLPAMKVGIVTDALAHLGRIRDAEVSAAPALAPWAFRTTVRVVADATGRAAFRRHRSHELVSPGHCLVAHPLVDEVLASGRFAPGSEVIVRASAATGERLVVVDGPTDLAEVPEGVSVVGATGVRGQGWLSERVAGRSWRVSGTSFFQARPDGAEALAAEVLAAVEAVTSADSSARVSRTATLVDAYAGVGLFAGVLRSGGWAGPVVAVERHGPATDDARVNLMNDDVEVVTDPVEAWSPVSAGVVVADPARAGLGRAAVEVLDATGAGALVLVSCDAAALGRDVGLLADRGFVHRRSVLVDMFPHTHHVEVVTLLVRC